MVIFTDYEIKSLNPYVRITEDTLKSAMNLHVEVSLKEHKMDQRQKTHWDSVPA